MATNATGGISSDGNTRLRNAITRLGRTTSISGGPEGDKSGEISKAIPSVGSPGEEQKWKRPAECREAEAWKADSGAPVGLNSPKLTILGGFGRHEMDRTMAENRSKPMLAPARL